MRVWRKKKQSAAEYGEAPDIAIIVYELSKTGSGVA